MTDLLTGTILTRYYALSQIAAKNLINRMVVRLAEMANDLESAGEHDRAAGVRQAIEIVRGDQ